MTLIDGLLANDEEVDYVFPTTKKEQTPQKEGEKSRVVVW